MLDFVFCSVLIVYGDPGIPTLTKPTSSPLQSGLIVMRLEPLELKQSCILIERKTVKQKEDDNNMWAVFYLKQNGFVLSLIFIT